METIEFLDIAAPAAQEAVDATPKVSKELALATLRTTAMAELSAVERGIAELRKSHGATDYDITTPGGYKLATERRHAVRLVRYKVPHVVSARKAELKAISESVSTEGDRIIAALREIEDPHDSNIDAEDKRRADAKAAAEAAEKARKEAHEANLATLRAYVAQAAGRTAAQIAAAITAIESITIGDSWQEYFERAGAAKLETLAALRALHDKTIAAEELAVEQERQRIENARVAAEQAAEAKRLEDVAEALRKQERDAEAKRVIQQKALDDGAAALARQQAKFADAQRRAAEPPPTAPESVVETVASPVVAEPPAAPIAAPPEPVEAPMYAPLRVGPSAEETRFLKVADAATQHGGTYVDLPDGLQGWLFTTNQLAALIEALSASIVREQEAMQCHPKNSLRS